MSDFHPGSVRLFPLIAYMCVAHVDRIDIYSGILRGASPRCEIYHLGGTPS